MERFALEHLPKDVYERVSCINFFWEEETLKGEAWLEDGWVFEYDESHYMSFDSREELINEVRNFTIKEVL